MVDCGTPSFFAILRQLMPDARSSRAWSRRKIPLRTPVRKILARVRMPAPPRQVCAKRGRPGGRGRSVPLLTCLVSLHDEGAFHLHHGHQGTRRSDTKTFSALTESALLHPTRIWRRPYPTRTRHRSAAAIGSPGTRRSSRITARAAGALWPPWTSVATLVATWVATRLSL
jgi:hypothetical protein